MMRTEDIGNNYGLGETRKKELGEACKALGITRQDRCVVLDKKYGAPLFLAMSSLRYFAMRTYWVGDCRIILQYGGIQI